MQCLDPQVDLTIEVKGNKTNVNVSWDEKKEEGEADDVEMVTNAHDQKVDTGEKITSLFCPSFSDSFFVAIH